MLMIFRKKFKSFKEAAESFRVSYSLEQSDLRKFLGDDINSLEDMKKCVEEIEKYDESPTSFPTNYPGVRENGFCYITMSGINGFEVNAVEENGNIVGYEAVYSVYSEKPLIYSSAYRDAIEEGWEYEERENAELLEFLKQKKYEDEQIKDMRENGFISLPHFAISYGNWEKPEVVAFFHSADLSEIETLLKGRPEIYEEVVEIAKKRLEEAKKFKILEDGEFRDSSRGKYPAQYYKEVQQEVIEALNKIINRELDIDNIDERTKKYKEFLKEYENLSEEEIDQRIEEENYRVEKTNNPAYIKEVADLITDMAINGNNHESFRRYDEIFDLKDYDNEELVMKIAEQGGKTVVEYMIYERTCPFSDDEENPDLNSPITKKLEELYSKLNTIWIVPNNDLESKTIIKMLEDRGQNVFVTNQTWGASWEGLEDEIKQKIEEAKAEGKEIYGVELQGNPEGVINIDHHIYGDDDRSSDEASIEQVAEILGIDLNIQEQFIAANDKGYIPAMKQLGKELEIEEDDINEVIDNIRMQDRECQGVTIEQEVQAQDAVKALGNIDEKRHYISITLPHSKTSTVTDRLFGKYDNLLVISEDGETNFFGETDVIKMLNEKFPGGWSGGQLDKGNGFWGGYADQKAIKEAVDEMMKEEIGKGITPEADETQR